MGNVVADLVILWVAPERWRLAAEVTREGIESCQTGAETAPGQPARRQRSVRYALRGICYCRRKFTVTV